MKSVLTVFIDSLKPESVRYMPFLNSFRFKRRVKTELGYSLTCHSSVYSGVYPDKHKVWFFWKYSPHSSPFKWIRKLHLDKLPHTKYTKFLCFAATKLVTPTKSLFGIPFYYITFWGLWHTLIKYWSYLDATEYYQTIFDILEANNIQFEVIYGAKVPLSGIKRHQIKPWTYIFIGDIDLLTHKYGQDSMPTRKRLREIDETLRKTYKLFEKEYSDFYFICFSDHGQCKVKGNVDLHALFRSHDKSLDDYVHFVDSTFARFWFRDEKEEKEVREILSDLHDRGFILTEELLKKYNLCMPDNRYGDLIFYLDAPYIFDHGNLSVMGKQFSVSAVEMHGYLPDYPESDGIFVSNREVLADSHVELVDIMPSILHALNIKVPDYVDGKVLWK